MWQRSRNQLLKPEPHLPLLKRNGDVVSQEKDMLSWLQTLLQLAPSRSIVKMKIDEDKIKTLSPHLLMAYSGEPGDTVQFAEYVENIRLYQIWNLYPLRPSAAASWIRCSLASSLRSRQPYAVNLLLGYDSASHDPHLSRDDDGYHLRHMDTVYTLPLVC